MTNPNVISTEIYQLSPTVYFKHAASGSLAIVWWILLPIALISLIGSAWDLRFALVGLIVLLLVTPMYVMHIYFSKLLNTDARAALAQKSLEFLSNGDITIHYYINDADGTPRPSSTERIPKTDIVQIAATSKRIVVKRHSTSAPLIIPCASIQEPQIVEKICRLYGEEIVRMA